jgi:hypothetical protein
MNPQLFAWDPDRSKRFTRIDNPPYDGEGKDLLLWNGAKVSPGTVINLVKTRSGLVPDFLYTVALLLVVSAKVQHVLQQLEIMGTEIHPVALRNQDGELIDRMFWLNVTKRVSLLDRERSTYVQSVTGRLFAKINVFRIMPRAVPREDLFLSEEGKIPIFSERAVTALRLADATGAVFTPLDGMAWP